VTPMPAAQVLDNYFLEARARLLDLAAILDRIHRGANAEKLDDVRLNRIDTAIKLLMEKQPNRAELVQEAFSLAYDPNWKLPAPKSPPVATGGR
jgi:hypothetical protein